MALLQLMEITEPHDFYSGEFLDERSARRFLVWRRKSYVVATLYINTKF